MEPAVENFPGHISTDLNTKSIDVDRESISKQDLTHKSNGIAEPDSASTLEKDNVEYTAVNEGNINMNLTEVEPPASECVADNTLSMPENSNEDVISKKHAAAEPLAHDTKENDKMLANEEISPSNQVDGVLIEEVVSTEPGDTPLGNDNVRFETEVMVEANDNDNVVESSIAEFKTEDHDTANNILNEMNQSIELSEVLRSSDISDNVENNNCTLGQEVFNKEELLDILEGNDVQSKETKTGNKKNTSEESKLALEQLNRLKLSMKKSKEHKKKPYVMKKKSECEEVGKEEENIVNALVRDWDDDETVEEEPTVENSSLNPTEQLVDSTTVDAPASGNKSSDDGQPQRRQGRVIKKKIIFDPDNPDTFTKGKIKNKNKEPQLDKVLPPSKKIKIEQTPHRAKSKSPIAKLQWKKPSLKINKQNKRLTEVDKLLMDEGAVNMIYQLTPEAPKGRKNMKTKAEFIKKIQSSTPETKEMKFRERKKESCKGEDGEAKKILSGKHRSSSSSLSSSVKTPLACDDFENHSADDSIIYRRHSSSSYSSSCMSPRRLSDVDTSNISSLNSTQANEKKSQIEGEKTYIEDGKPCIEDGKPHIEGEKLQSDGDKYQIDNKESNNEKSQDEGEKPHNESEKISPGKNQLDKIVASDIINKDDCLTIKRKLNSKLSLALTKRKRENSKTEKTPNKQIVKPPLFKYLTLSLVFDQRVAEISIKDTGSKCNVEVLQEMCKALTHVDMRNDVSITILTSHCGTLCPEVDLTPLLNEDIDKRIKLANEITESVRSLLRAVVEHSKLLCAGVWGECAGLALSLVALSDVAVAAESTSFALTRAASSTAPVPPGLSAVISSCRRLQPSLVDDLVIFNRKLSSFEALQGGLVSRTLLSAGFQVQFQCFLKTLADQPIQNILLKKKLLDLRKEPKETLLSHIEMEGALMTQFWISDEGQDMIRSSQH